MQLLELERPAEALVAAKAARAAEPNDPDAHAFVAQCALLLGDFTEARAAAETATQMEPHWLPAWVFLAAASHELGDDAASSQAAGVIRVLDPVSPVPDRLEAMRHLRRQRWDDAAEAAGRALELAPEDEVALGIRAAALAVRGRRHEASAAADAQLRRSPDSADSHSIRGFVALRAGETAAAKRHALEALRLDPGDDAAREVLIGTLKERSLLLKPTFVFQRWLQRFPPRAQAAVLIGGWLGSNVLVRVLDAVESPLVRVT